MKYMFVKLAVHTIASTLIKYNLILLDLSNSKTWAPNALHETQKRVNAFVTRYEQSAMSVQLVGSSLDA